MNYIGIIIGAIILIAYMFLLWYLARNQLTWYYIAAFTPLIVALISLYSVEGIGIGTAVVGLVALAIHLSIMYPVQKAAENDEKVFFVFSLLIPLVAWIYLIRMMFK